MAGKRSAHSCRNAHTNLISPAQGKHEAAKSPAHPSLSQSTGLSGERDQVTSLLCFAKQFPNSQRSAAATGTVWLMTPPPLDPPTSRGCARLHGRGGSSTERRTENGSTLQLLLQHPSQHKPRASQVDLGKGELNGGLRQSQGSPQRGS